MASTPASDSSNTPLVVQYLYVHAPGDSYEYPSSRAQAGPEQLAARYLECALVQAATLRLQGADCRLALVSNVTDARTLGPRGSRLWAEIESLDVEMLHADYRHRPPHELSTYASSRYVLDAIDAACELAGAETPLWLTDVDCVWVDPALTFAAAPQAPALSCVHIGYPPDWKANGFSPSMLGDVAAAMGGPDAPVRWVGGELLCGSVADLGALLAACEELEAEMADHDMSVTTEEQVFSLAAALGRATFQDVSHVARRIWTGPRHGAPPVAEPHRLGLWHLPSEKGLGFRRAAAEILAGRTQRLARDLEDPIRAMARFNVHGAGLRRRIRDDAWLTAQRLRAVVRQSRG